jgi:hypothetical protein
MIVIDLSIKGNGCASLGSDFETERAACLLIHSLSSVIFKLSTSVINISEMHNLEYINIE